MLATVRPAAVPLISAILIAAFAGVAFGLYPTRGRVGRPQGLAAPRLGRSITIGTVAQLAASFIAPAALVAAGHPDLALPVVVTTLGPLLIWFGARLGTPRHLTLGVAFTVIPTALALTVHGDALTAITGIGGGVALGIVAGLGLRDIADLPPEPTLTQP